MPVLCNCTVAAHGIRHTGGLSEIVIFIRQRKPTNKKPNPDSQPAERLGTKFAKAEFRGAPTLTIHFLSTHNSPCVFKMNEERKLPVALLIDPLTGGEHYISRYTTCIGRSPSCDLPLPDRSISRQHALLFCFENEFYIEDLNSLNGTVLNGKAVKERTKLEAGDELRIGLSCLLFMLIPDRRAKSREPVDAVRTEQLEDPVSGRRFSESIGRRNSAPHVVVNN